MALVLLLVMGDSLWQAKQAFQQHNLIAFEKYVDVETMAENWLCRIENRKFLFCFTKKIAKSCKIKIIINKSECYPGNRMKKPQRNEDENNKEHKFQAQAKTTDSEKERNKIKH